MWHGGFCTRLLPALSDQSNSPWKCPGAGHRTSGFAAAEGHEVPAGLAFLQASWITFYYLFWIWRYLWNLSEPQEINTAESLPFLLIPGSQESGENITEAQERVTRLLRAKSVSELAAPETWDRLLQHHKNTVSSVFACSSFGLSFLVLLLIFNFATSPMKMHLVLCIPSKN